MKTRFAKDGPAKLVAKMDAQFYEVYDRALSDIRQKIHFRDRMALSEKYATRKRGTK